MTSRLCMVLVFVLGLPAALCAQKQQGSWSDLRGLRVGQGIVVIEASMKHHDGEFVSFTDDGPTLQEEGSDVWVKREDVVRVSTASGARRGEHAVIGLVVGGLIGAGIGAIAADHSTGNGFWSWKAQPGIGRSPARGANPLKGFNPLGSCSSNCPPVLPGPEFLHAKFCGFSPPPCKHSSHTVTSYPSRTRLAGRWIWTTSLTA